MSKEKAGMSTGAKIKIGIYSLLAIALVAFGIQNIEPVPFDLLFWTVSVSLILLIVISILVGLAIGLFIGNKKYKREHKKTKELSDSVDRLKNAAIHAAGGGAGNVNK